MAIRELKRAALWQWARLEARLAGLGPGAGPQLARRALWWVAKAVVVAVLPFFVLVRVSVFLYSHYAYPTWLAVAAGVCCTLVVVTAYAAWISRRLTGRAPPPLLVLARRVALPVALAYCGYALLFLSSANAKSERVRSYYTALHPLLRLALSTWILVDRTAVVTDLARRPEDYAALGLPVNDGSLHLVQRDGYVHAADLRTGGRGWIRNGLLRLYFWGMGFTTLRHGRGGRGGRDGRAARGAMVDHLHVELPAP